MSQSDRPDVTFTAAAADGMAEIFLIDGTFRLVDRGIGSKTFTVPAGMYKLKYRSGGSTREQLLVVREGMPETIELGKIAFTSPIPLADTAKTHEFHMAAAQEVCGRVDAHQGHGSAIVVLVRDWTADRYEQQNAVDIPDPSRGLRLRTLGGDLLADLEAGSTKHLDREPWATCQVAVDPGTYRLALDLPDGVRVEQTLVASPGWATHVYLLMNRTVKGEPRADLVSGAITLLPLGATFDPADPNLRIEELARIAVAEQRTVLSPELRARITDPAATPMLALLGAHLLIEEARWAHRVAQDRGGSGDIDNTAPVRTIVENLRAKLGAHPDVEAIAIRAGARDPNFLFTAPPMLRASWASLIRASVDDPSLVPAGSLSARVADRLWGEGPWLLWIDPDSAAEGERATWQAAVLQVLQQTRDEVTVAATESTDWTKRFLAPFRRRSRRAFPTLEEAPAATPASTLESTLELKRPEGSLRELLTDIGVRKEIVRRTGMPLSRIAQWLEKDDQ